jgi:hypothetical protein
LKHGPGTCPSCNSTIGFYHHLEDLMENGLDFVKKVDAKQAGFNGRPDILERIGGKWFQRELKNLAPGKKLGRKALAQLDGNIAKAIERATNSARIAGNPGLTVDFMRDELMRMRYVFRGRELDNPAVRNQIHRGLLKQLASLGPQFKQLADQAPGFMVEFQGKRLPLP